MSNKRALVALIPAAILCSVLLVGLEQSGRQSSAPTLDATVNPSGATVASRTASAQSVRTEEAGIGGDGGTSIRATPASTSAVQALVEEAESETQSDPTPQPEPTAVETVTVVATALVAEPVTKESAPELKQGPLRGAIEAAFPPSQVETAYWIAMCESGGDPEAVGALGEQGAWQVRPEFHGPVPADIYGQAQQAARIVAASGWSPWSCA